MDTLPLPAPAPAPLATVSGFDLLSAVLSGRNARTLRAYEGDYRDFADFLQAPSPGAALDQLVAAGQGPANAVVLAYRAQMAGRGLAPATVARRLAALRSAVRTARMVGLAGWSLEVEAPKAEAYRDTRGPGREGWRRLLEEARARPGPAGRRDVALLRLLHDLALRRAEAVGLDLEDLDLPAGTVKVLGKGRTGKTVLTLPPATRAALADWLAVRGPEPGPLFFRLDKGRGAGGRLTGRSVARVVEALGRSAGLSGRVRPHGLRHQAVTEALDRTNGDVRAVQKFSRHKKLDTLMVYDDNRRDLAGDVARLVAED